MSLRDMGDRSQKTEVRIKAGDGVGEVPAMSLRDMGDRSQKSEVRIKAGDSVGHVRAALALGALFPAIGRLQLEVRKSVSKPRDARSYSDS